MLEVLYILLPPLFCIAGYTEVKERRIPNWLTMSCLICAVAGSFAVGGPEGFKSSLYGVLLGGGIFLPFCLAGVLGGGDFKLMAAVGAVVGYPLILWCLYYTVLSGGVLAILYAIWTGRLLSTLTGLCRLLIGRKVRKESEGLTKAPILPYGIAIAAGTVWAILLQNVG